MVWLEISCWRPFIGLALGDDGKNARAGGGAGRRILELVVLAWGRRATDYPAVAEALGQTVASLLHGVLAAGAAPV